MRDLQADLDEAEQLCDRVGLLKDGALVAANTVTSGAPGALNRLSRQSYN